MYMNPNPTIVIAFASRAHGPQKYGDRPFTVHLKHVVDVIRRFGFNDPNLENVAWLHDVVEDTNTTLEDIEERFGSHIRDAVDALTDVTQEELIQEGHTNTNRAARKRATYAKTQKVPEAVIVKLADRIANVESSWADPDDKLMRLYLKEHGVFRDYLYGNPGSALVFPERRIFQMENYLDRLLLGWEYLGK